MHMPEVSSSHYSSSSASSSSDAFDSSQSALLNVALGASIFVAGISVGASVGAETASAYVARSLLVLLIIIVTAELVPKLLVQLHEKRKAH
ncbi:hypothetical protein BC829DRAFT_447190 [Chytridium lagenaria]|nr:hypothetical protein BC829DRAFT_447190 [Chytridium lagenaria]